MNIHEQFKGGFTRGSGINTEEILHDDRVTNEHKLQFLMYDANLYPCPDLSTWKPKAKQEVIDFVKEQVAKVNADVWVDDVQVKTYEVEK
ncbi:MULTISPECIES: hypothetical protein [Lacticaseibacillus]|uniref:Hypothetical phage protein n=1 Tax=Lacticaseibacillus casei DSM 20011 = JCM 1134 = ATCC 393 TaxID=1423732 RepID=A0AAD1ANK4_LACCA|nr:hypothetical protein [Lacticaseibacillus casei]MBI6598697.1 hypothetical protein [Lacticaseibacillus casei]MBO1482439.1 hypothetical protein [Lacticaseibacillus casei]MBO2417741.1 hypothetical protein [Lacticaseibacillus casei]MCK2082009.1 hypothetical protein [Lacticaseibacillus casei]MED7631459.1 hypothetical protein [Lacticaseibacillus casei]